MIKINLLPFRAARKKENVRRQVFIFLGLIIIFVLGCLGFSMWQMGRISSLKGDLDNAQAELVKYNRQAKKVDKIQAEIDALNKRLTTINSLNFNRSGPVRLMDHLTGLVAEESAGQGKKEKRLWLLSLTTNETEGVQSIKLEGVAVNNKDVAGFLERLEKLPSDAIDLPKPIEIQDDRKKAAQQEEEELPPPNFFSEVRLVKLSASEDPFLLNFKDFQIECKKPVPGAKTEDEKEKKK